ncbi:MAG: cytochrome c oxidase assembly factor Coa1 family protein [Polyangiaceae bacterium]
MENSSGQGKQAVVPPEVDRWNWGAFFLGWIWGLANNVLIALLAFVPCVNIFMPFVLGMRGSAWAWQHKRWNSVEEFRKAQRGWAVAGFVLFGFGILCIVAGVFAFLLMFKHSEIAELSFQTVRRDPEAIRVLGTPMDTGFVLGSINSRGNSGSADISFSINGPKASGKVYTQATRDLGAWHIDRMELAIDGTPTRIPLVVAAPLAPGLPAKPGEL